MSLFVDTSVWSLALRRDSPGDGLELGRLREALASQEAVYTTGLVLQELLQGFRGPKAHDSIVEHFAALPMIVPGRDDHIVAADIRNTCRRQGVQLGTIDALLAEHADRPPGGLRSEGLVDVLKQQINTRLDAHTGRGAGM